MDKQIFTAPTAGKNITGELGPICNYCGGYGYTNGLGGNSSGCPRCNGDGIEPVDVRELKEQVKKLTLLVGDICSALEKNKILIQPSE